MIASKSILITIISFCLLFPFHQEDREDIKVEIITSHGIIVVELYDETPLHRDNFAKLVKDGVYDSLLFHRVIEGFMIQGGDTKSKYANDSARLGNSDLNYRVPAEFRPNLFHKKGVLAAARTGNAERASSSTQFYLVQGEIQNDSLLTYNQGRINQALARHYAVNDPLYPLLLDSLNSSRKNQDSARYEHYKKLIDFHLENYDIFEKYEIPEAHRAVYKEIGGTPHLDQNYTVFGEIISGLGVVDSIAGVETGARDRPVQNVRIFKMRIIED